MSGSRKRTCANYLRNTPIYRSLKHIFYGFGLNPRGHSSLKHIKNMNLFNTILIGGWCVLFTFSANASHISAFPNAYSYCNFSTTELFKGTKLRVAAATFVDDDKDGISNEVDCAPNNPNLPAKPGTPCNDNNDFTKNDKVQADACTCIGTTIKKDSPITIDLGEDRLLDLNETITISTNVLQFNTCIVTTCKEETPLIAHWNLDNITSKSSKDNTDDYSASINTSSNNSFCANIVTKGLYRSEGADLIPTKSYSSKAKKAIMADMPLVPEFQDNHPQSLRFDIIVDPSANVSRITKLTFMEKAPAKVRSDGSTKPNNTPTKYGIRVLKGGKQIYKAIDMMTSKSWAKAVFDFSNEPIFEVSSTTVFTVELLGYDQSIESTTASAWNIDDIKVYGGCCNTSSFQSSRYLWSTGQRTNSIDVKEVGSYTVTVTDCNGTTAVDEVLVTKK